MNYEGQICRAPMERASFMLPVMVGCSYNRCRFCILFKHLKYRVLPLEQIEEELRRVKNAGGNPERIFLGDGNAFDLPSERLLEILEMVHIYFPDCQSVNMDATVTGIQKKSDEELRQLYEAGVRHLYIGIESGLDDVLAFMDKDHTLAEAYEAIKRLREAGLVYDAHIMTGVAGSGRGVENAEHLAEFLNRTKPARVINFSMFIYEEAPLYERIRTGEFIPASEIENLIEARQLIKLLDVQGLAYDGFHDYVEFRVWGQLPKDREKMIKILDKKIESCYDLKTERTLFCNDKERGILCREYIR